MIFSRFILQIQMHLLGTLNKIANQVTRAIIIAGDINKGKKKWYWEDENEEEERGRADEWMNG